MLKRLFLPRPLPRLTPPEERADYWRRVQRVSRRANELSAGVERWDNREHADEHR